jgi:hypothetical protein
MVIAQNSAQSLAADNLALGGTDVFRWLNQLVTQGLMIPFLVVMFEILFYCGMQRVFAKEDHPRQGLGFKGPHEPL